MQRNWNIALAHDHLFQIGGAERVLQEVARLFPNAPLYSLIQHPRSQHFFPDVKIHTSFLQRLPGGTRWFKLYLGLMPKAWERFDFSGYDLVISSCSAFVKGIRTPPHAKHISYCHAPTRYLWDEYEYVNSLRMSPVIRSIVVKLLSELREWDLLAASRVDYFIANSHHISKRIKKYYGRDSIVIYPPVEVTSFETSKTIGDYYLIVSRLRPYKQVQLAIEAFNNLKLPLLIIGGGEEMKRLRRLAKRNIYFLGEVSDEKRNYYLARCRAFLQPQEEDFGISAVEAMASGRPVVAFRAGGALETIREKVSGVLFDEQSWESLAFAVINFKPEEYDPLIIRRYASQFDTSIFRHRLLSFVEGVMNE